MSWRLLLPGFSVDSVYAAEACPNVHSADSQTTNGRNGELITFIDTVILSSGLVTHVFLQTGRKVPPLTESERTVKVLMGEGNFKVSNHQLVREKDS